MVAGTRVIGLFKRALSVLFLLVRAACRPRRVWIIGGMIPTGGKPRTGREPYPSATFRTTNVT